MPGTPTRSCKLCSKPSIGKFKGQRLCKEHKNQFGLCDCGKDYRADCESPRCKKNNMQSKADIHKMKVETGTIKPPRGQTCSCCSSTWSGEYADTPGQQGSPLCERHKEYYGFCNCGYGQLFNCEYCEEGILTMLHKRHIEKGKEFCDKCEVCKSDSGQDSDATIPICIMKGE